MSSPAITVRLAQCSAFGEEAKDMRGKIRVQVNIIVKIKKIKMKKKKGGKGRRNKFLKETYLQYSLHMQKSKRALGKARVEYLHCFPHLSDTTSSLHRGAGGITLA
ncbi:unnamed protein product [Ixodes pacificus]